MVLPYEVNPYGDAVVNTKALSRDVVKNRFTEEIIETYVRWKTERIKGVWVHVSLEDCHVVPDLAKLGFTFVHAATHELTMTLWLGEEPSRLPSPRASFSYFSVSGMVLDAEGRVLMVREHRRRHLWKFPGGMAEPNEHLLETAERKVLEETGIIARAESVISLRQRRRTEYQGACGFFFVCLMRYIEDASVSLAETLADDIVAMKWFTRDDIKLLPKHEFFDHHRAIWNAYEKSLENSTSEDLSEAGDRNVTSRLFNFSYF